MKKVACLNLPLIFLPLSFPILAQSTSSSQCSCYIADSLLPSNLSSSLPSQQTYSVRSFTDFRSFPPSSYTSSPPPVLNSQSNGTEPPTSPYFTSQPFSSTWNIQTWTQPAIPTKDIPVDVVNSAQNIFIHADNSSTSTHLRLRTTRLDSFSSIAEIDTVTTSISHGTFRIMARVSGAPGACAGLFTYYNDTNESDIEILTRDPDTQFRATNQPDVDDSGNGIPGASTIEPLSPSSTLRYTDWHVYRLDWFPSATIWIVDGDVVATKELNVPREPSSFNLNMWSNGGSWTGNMSVGSEAYLDVQWIELVYNTDDGTPSCSSTCNLDQVDAALNLNSTTVKSAASKNAGWSIFGGLVGLLLLVRVLQMWAEQL